MKSLNKSVNSKLKKILTIILVTLFAFNINLIEANEKLIPDSSITVTGAAIDESNISAIFYVDNANENAADSNPGTENEPIKTLAKAVELAMEKNRNGEGTKIIIKAGVYREILNITRPGQVDDAPFVIEGENKEDVIIKGSVIFRDKWELNDGFYTNSWILGFGVTRNVYDGDYDVDIAEIVRRRDMIFVNDFPLEQVSDKSEVSQGKFFIDEDAKTAYMLPPQGVDMDSAVVEIPIYDKLVNILEAKNLVIRNLTLKQSNPFHPGASVVVYRGSNILIENCDIVDNNWFGIGIHEVFDVTFNKLTVNNNGGGGIQGSRLKNFLIIDCETSHNNWRGQQGDYYDWDTSGIKLLFAYQIKILRHKAINNYTHGIWFDSDCRDLIVEDSIMSGNNGKGESIISGLYLEGGVGPYYINRCIIISNHRGVNIAAANDVYISDSVIADNLTCQINLFNNWGQGRTFEGWESGENITSYAINNIIENTIISSPVGKNVPFFDYDWNDPGAYPSWFRTLKTNNISYFHPNPDEAFLTADTRSRASFEIWKEISGLDEDANWVFAPPANLVATSVNDDEIKLTWQPSADDVKGYKIYNYYTEIGDTTDTSFEYAIDMQNDNILFVRAYDNEGNLTAGTNLLFLSSKQTNPVDSNPSVSSSDESNSDDSTEKETKPVDTDKILVILIIVVALILLGSLFWYIKTSKSSSK